jgi:anti-anti-sigma regulatory factor
MEVSTFDGSLVLMAPERLTAETRVEFRCDALELIERVHASGGGALDIDLSATKELDASGLGILVLVQKRACDNDLTTRLMHAPERVRNLLLLTKLDFLFAFVD